MLARIDTENKQVDLVSIPRDMQVSINGGSTPQKINAAYAMGGSSLMISTVSDFAGVPISHYIKVGFDGLEQLVDRLGGITVNVPESFSGEMAVFHCKPENRRSTGNRRLVLHANATSSGR